MSARNLARRRRVWCLLPGVVAIVIASAACGEGDAGSATTTSTTLAVSTSTNDTVTTSSTPGGTSSVPQVTSTSTTSTTVPSTTTLPGEPFDGFVQAGDLLGVVGVAFDDVLNVRLGPGVSFAIVARLEPTATALVATGRERLIPGAIWYEVTTAGTVGWVNSRYVAYIGGVDDLTSMVVERLGGTTPTSMSMIGLAEIVADALKSDDPPSRVTVTVAPTFGDLAEITVDVIGLGDDATYGLRLHVFGESLQGGRYSLKSVESTALCGRGATTDGLCV